MEGVNIRITWRIFSRHEFLRPHLGPSKSERLVMRLRMSMRAQIILVRPAYSFPYSDREQVSFKMCHYPRRDVARGKRRE